MGASKTVPSSLKEFLENGIETVVCSICTEPFDEKHVVVEIKDCGHQFGQICLEKWLEQNKTQGTCPMCRDVLFSVPRPKHKLITIAPVSPTRFCEYYNQVDNVVASAHSGFLARLWSNLYRMYADGEVHLSRATMQAFDSLSGPEHDALYPYIRRIRRLGISRTWGTCIVTSLIHTLIHFTACCDSDFRPSNAVWRAFLLFHAEAGNALLDWGDIRDAAWRLQQCHTDGRATGNQWQVLYLFLYLMAIHRAQKCGTTPIYKIKDIRDLLTVLNCERSSSVAQTRDTNTRLFLSAAGHVLDRSKIDAEFGKDDRSRRLLSHTTDLAQLKKDVEGLWLEGLAIGTAEIAAGFPDNWWSGP
ncbi:uncharacterized protein K460DRAFT_328629 [Cucurbitaria berberidis CBS 394.84]|uniref:RING-type domain-containing protein n=1 Tax=Cucurbitaria berberidis CBS 394.84 TaxID=1168544 RepID=A0A9P4GTJ3_9PLEO|nr:uncharacterized protein K460DRAFT_328629 [Cucurbitaria berberidis CBS 394.84]KAF1851067.1 hypothetical protein K460DRAFT_328629 [Cucurbitaria berberidis CBS 394.84]